MKWLGVIVLVIVGALAAYVAVEYFTVGIHALPSYIPGHKAAVPGHLYRGHYRKRGAVAALVALVCFVVAGLLAYRIVRSDKQPVTRVAAPETPAATSADQII